jgi:hypothetical protein
VCFDNGVICFVIIRCTGTFFITLCVAEHRVYLHYAVSPVFICDVKGFWDNVMILVLCCVGNGMVLV